MPARKCPACACKDGEIAYLKAEVAKYQDSIFAKKLVQLGPDISASANSNFPSVASFLELYKDQGAPKDGGVNA